MKVLDVSSLHDGIKGMNRQLSAFEKKLNHVENGIRTFVSSKDSFRGKGASAIRRFYEYAHLSFLQFFQTFLANFQSKLQQLQLELDGLESNTRGFIDEGFLTIELEDGLNQISRMVTELTGETNAQLSRVSDIVYLPRLQDHQFHEGIQHAKQSANQTLDKLHQFDHQQTQSFTALITDLSLLQNYIEEISQQFVSGRIKLASFSPAMLQDLEAYGKLQTKLYNQTAMQRWNSEHFPELGVFYPIGHAASFDQWVNPSCARPEPKKKTAGEVFWDFTNGFGSGIISAASDTWDGIKRLATEPDQVLKETIEFLDAVASDPAILLEIGQELYNSFNESVIHGDANSRGEWLGYATTILGTSVVGEKGLSKVGGIAGKLGTKVETDLNIKLKEQQEKVMSSVKGSSAVGLERVRELMGQVMPNHHLQPGFAGVPHNVMDGKTLRDRIKANNHYHLAKIETASGITSSKTKTKFKGEEIPLEWLGEKYKAVEVSGEVKVNGKNMDISRRVYQLENIEWEYTPVHPSARGLSNRELALKGRPPFVLDKNGMEVQVELHHIIQKEPGSMVEILATTHNEYKKILHGLIADGNSFRNDPVLDKQFNNFRRSYWKYRSDNLGE